MKKSARLYIRRWIRRLRILLKKSTRWFLGNTVSKASNMETLRNPSIRYEDFCRQKKGRVGWIILYMVCGELSHKFPNDTNTESCANVRAILRGAKQYTVLMVGPPPVLDDEKNKRIEDLSVAFSRETQALGVPYINLFSALCTDDAYKREVAGNDGSHPRSEGYSKMTRIIGSSPSWWFHVTK